MERYRGNRRPKNAPDEFRIVLENGYRFKIEGKTKKEAIQKFKETHTEFKDNKIQRIDPSWQSWDCHWFASQLS